MDNEKIRESYRPRKVKILFVGESAPASGDFFYVRSNMTAHTKRAFEIAYERAFDNQTDFLNFFKEQGCYLDDLSHEPVDCFESKRRMQILQECVPSFSQRIFEMNPDVVLIALKRIEKYVREAISYSGKDFECFVLPFAGMSHQNKYVDELTEILRKHVR